MNSVLFLALLACMAAANDVPRAQLFSPLGKGRPFHFETDITPILTRFQCNSSGCHAQAEGQNGFKLSVFGSDPESDYAALVKASRGRRVQFAAPDFSLVLRKASGQIAHGGGTRLRPGTLEYETLRNWVQAGAPFGDPAAPKVVALRVEPKERMLGMDASQPLRVVARFSDGFEADVTALARFSSHHEGLAIVSDTGVVKTGRLPGEAAIMASYLGEVDVFRALIPRAEKVDPAKLPETNFVDTHVHARLRKLNLMPSDQADDSAYLRRVYLDLIGTLPTPNEVRSFLADKGPDKRTRVVDALMDRPEFADYWALLWSDMLRIDRQALGPKRAHLFYRWVHDNLSRNRPFDAVTRDVLLAEGPLDDVGPANFFKTMSKPGDAASTVAQVFLGVRIACAECHHHPFDRWSQTDYYGMQSYFTPLAVQKTERGEHLLANGSPVSKNPRSGTPVYAHALGTSMPERNPDGDRRTPLAKWLTAPENPWFAKNLANRLWAHFFGRGLIDPVDDVRDTNPPSNPELLDALAQYVKQSQFDLKKVLRVIVASRAYQRDCRPNATNERDELYASRALFRRIPAEVLLDMVSQATGIEERFKGMPLGTRAIQLWDSKTPHYFLKLFGRPQRMSACSCERVIEPSVAQVLHLFNAPEIHRKITHERGSVARLTAAHVDDGALIDELYLTFLCRLPNAAEKERAGRYFANQTSDRRGAAEDLAWSLMNTLEFVFNH